MNERERSSGLGDTEVSAEEMSELCHGPVQVERLYELVPGAEDATDVADTMRRTIETTSKQRGYETPSSAPAVKRLAQVVGPGAHRAYEVTVQIRQGRNPMWSTVPIPAERLEPGPRSHRFHVVDVNITTGTGRDAAVLTVSDGAADHGWWFHDRFADITTAPPPAEPDPRFLAQNVFAVASRTLSLFEQVLGRRVQWRNRRSQLFLVPAAFVSANAHYSPQEGAVYFGYLPANEAGDPAFYTCLSHDIVTHEVTHAILDGLRPRFLEASLPDQRAFHEAIADIVAMLSVLSFEKMLQVHLDPHDTGTVSAEVVGGVDRLRKSDVLGLAIDLADRTSSDPRVRALRRSVTRRPEDVADWAHDERFVEPHLRGEILVAVVMDTFVRMWDRRIAVFRKDRSHIPTDRVCEEGAKAASHLLAMVIRSLDYLPPVEVEFGDVYDAIIVADETVAPDDSHNYRGALTAAFESWGIERPAGRTLDAAENAGKMVYTGINFDQLASSTDEVARWIWHNAHLIGIDLSYRLDVERVYVTNRAGPDGLFVREIVAGYTQRIEARARDLAAGLEGSEDVGLDDDAEVQMWGGGVIIFDQFGRFRVHQRKPLDDVDRQNRRLRFLVTNHIADTPGRIGFSLGESSGQEFAALHRYDDRPVW